MDGLGAGGGEGTEETAVEAALEGKNGELRAAGRFVAHRRVQLLLVERTAAAFLFVVVDNIRRHDEGDLACERNDEMEWSGVERTLCM